jgi:outer membrane protein assembly factor BamB
MKSSSILFPPGLLAVAVLLSGSFLVTAEHWPQWRGPSGTGLARETQLPLRWGTNENVVWKSPLPDRGNSTPIIWGQRVFLTQSLEKQQRHSILCLDKKDGRVIWERVVEGAAKEPTHETNPPGSSSPVTDGERVVSWFGSAGIICHDLDGKELWRRNLGPQHHIWGWGASPVLEGDFCILNFGPGEPSFVVALDKRTGEERWRVPVPDADSGDKKPGQEKAVWAGSWSTPIVIQPARQKQLILTWPREVVALDIPTGKKLWSCAGLNPLVYTSPLYDPPTRTIVAMGGFNGMALAVKADGTNDVTTTHRLWHHPKTRQRIGSGVIHEGHIYIHNDPGIAECWELATGKLVWEERLRGPAAKGDNWSSMILAGGKLYTVNQGGDAFVLRASPQLEILATNSLAEPTIASMAVSDGQLFIRTYRHLWCIGRQ